MTDYEKISSEYKLVFFNFFLQEFLQKFGGYNLDHDEMVYKLANFGSKVRPTYISFSFGTRQQDINMLIDMLQGYDIFDVKQIEFNIVKIIFPFTYDKVKQLKQKKFKDSQKTLKDMILECYKKIRKVEYVGQEVHI